MRKVSTAQLEHLKNTIAALEHEFNNWRPHYQDLAKYILPRRYDWLQARPLTAGTGDNQYAQQSGATGANKRNEYILDPTGTKAARTLAAGMFNGITSPARPWFRPRFAGFSDEATSIPAKRWLDEVQRRMLTVMAESNFYGAMALQFLDLSVFGTAATLIYEDFDEVIRCYNCACGEYRLGQDDRKMVDRFSRSPVMTVSQLVKRFGFENCSQRVQDYFKRGGSSLQQPVVVCHLIEPNDNREGKLPARFKYREYYWERDRNDGVMLSIAGFEEHPLMAPRWELVGSDTYGTAPSMDALPDIMQLQHETKAKGQALDFMVRPPIVADASLRNRPSAFAPRGITFVPSSSQVGAKAIYTVNPPIAEMKDDLMQIQARIKEMFHNDLFRMISELSTVRTATEIDARREEKLTLLGAVLERHENEALDPAVKRIFSIMKRKDLIPAPPPGFENVDIEIEYVSILADAQRAASSGPIERFLQVIGETAAVNPSVLDIPDWSELIRDYADRINVPAVGIKPRAQVAAEAAQRAQQEQLAQLTEAAPALTGAAKNLADADVGGGQNALSALIGG